MVLVALTLVGDLVTTHWQIGHGINNRLLPSTEAQKQLQKVRVLEQAFGRK
jgi:hypothetical protein